MSVLLSMIMLVLAVACCKRAIRSSTSGARPFPFGHDIAFEDPALDALDTMPAREPARVLAPALRTSTVGASS